MTSNFGRNIVHSASMQNTPCRGGESRRSRSAWAALSADRLLHEDVLAGLQSQQGAGRWARVRGGDVDDVDVGVGDELLVASRRPGRCRARPANACDAGGVAGGRRPCTAGGCGAAREPTKRSAIQPVPMTPQRSGGRRPRVRGAGGGQGGGNGGHGRSGLGRGQAAGTRRDGPAAVRAWTRSTASATAVGDQPVLARVASGDAAGPRAPRRSMPAARAGRRRRTAAASRRRSRWTGSARSRPPPGPARRSASGAVLADDLAADVVAVARR